MASKKHPDPTPDGTWADRMAPGSDPTWHAEYHDAWEGLVLLDADAAGHVAIGSEAADRAAQSMGLAVIGAVPDTTPEV
jgi:hypothetical protein